MYMFMYIIHNAIMAMTLGLFNDRFWCISKALVQWITIRPAFAMSVPGPWLFLCRLANWDESSELWVSIVLLCQNVSLLKKTYTSNCCWEIIKWTGLYCESVKTKTKKKAWCGLSWLHMDPGLCWTWSRSWCQSTQGSKKQKVKAWVKFTEVITTDYF